VIDFRYHLVSIVAVFLALGIGILMGSLVLGEALVKRLNADLTQIRNTNDRLRGDVTDLRSQMEAGQDFALAARPYLIANRLAGDEIVLFTFDGVSSGLLDETRNVIDDAGGTIITTITLRDKLALSSVAERDELALLLASEASSADELHRAAGVKIGSLCADASAQQNSAFGENPEESQTPQLDALMEGLRDTGYVDVDRTAEEPLVPPDASFLIVGGSDGEEPFDLRRLTVSMADQLSSSGGAVLAAESSTSAWGLVDVLRDDVATSDAVATVDQAESISGGIAVAMALDLAQEGNVSHYGVRSGADDIIPEPTPTP
jgi:Copper transport outer membrane protein, MctB